MAFFLYDMFPVIQNNHIATKKELTKKELGS